MPKKKKEPFIDPNHATTYRLVPGFVPDDPYEEKAAETEEEIEKRKSEQREYGVYYEDNYNYMKHLRSLKEVAVMVKVSDLEPMEDEMMSTFGGSSIGRPASTIGRPASSIGPTGSSFGASASSFIFKMFPPKYKERQERIDPDILQSFDEATKVKITEDGPLEPGDDDNFLDDDFINQAGGYKPKPEREDDDDDFGIDRGFAIDEEQDLGSDFEDYDFDIAEDNDFDDGVHANLPEGRGTVQDDIVEAQTALILKNFEEGFGFSHVAQDMDDEEGRATAEDYEYLKEIVAQEKRKQEKIVTAEQLLDNHKDRPDFDYSKYDKSDEEEEEFEWKELPPSKPKFDCVSILSLNSNTRNLPTDIIPPSCEKKRSKVSSTSETDPSLARGLSQRELEEEIRLSRRADKASTFKPKDETPEERRSRKKAVKDERRERRQEKKANRVVFSMEKQNLAKEAAAMSKSGKGIKL